MDGIVIARHSWIVTCDGAKMLVLRNDGDAQALNLTVQRTETRPTTPTRELGTDQPGRFGMGTVRSATEETDWQEQAEAEFLAHVAQHLDTMVQAGTVGRMVLAAPPRALGILRKHLTPATRDVIVAEVAKDLTNLPVPDIQQLLAA
ncbi:baeRF12 domain-containing protein [Nitrospirillum bahiense]|uniref:Protein required for attachment to host cells n=1 Tax=Nitrospirillum amazonense TaxID=28077 RepID=A0A560FTS1_9PROT|nr:host attachment family protein [Nitrospirillum amazonense]TWB25029.1 protein required for attachment to host cells [Nitrospirillum amazonense]